MAAWLGQYDEGFAHAERGLAAARETGDMALVGGALVNFGVLWEVSGDCRKSEAAYQDAVAVLRTLPDHFLFGIALGELGDRQLVCGDLDEGIRLIEEAIEQDRKVGYRFAMAIALGQLAHAHRLQGELDLARKYFGESVAVANELGDGRRILGAFIGLAGVALDEGDPERAARLIGATEKARETRGVARVIAHPLHNARIIAAIREQLGDEAYEALVAEGRAIPYEQLLAEALAEAGEGVAGGGKGISGR
jgi:tetratricopeptide (TPR) repeat protein